MATTDQLINWDKNHMMHALYPTGQHCGIIWEEGNGVTLKDTTGKEYIDFCAQLDCVNLGYGRSELVAAATEQMQKLSYAATFFGFSNRTSIECGIKLAELTPPGLDNFSFTAGGSESTELSFILSRVYWRHKGAAGKHKIISLYDSYHGMTFAARSCTGLGKGTLEAGVLQKVPGFIHIPSFYCYRCMFGKEYPRCGIQCARFLGEVIEKEGPDTVAAFIAEPVMGATGMIPPPPEYWPLVRDICNKYSVLLIADEVMTGFCRTGRMFAVEHWEIRPDIMTLAKGITSAYFPVGAVAISNEIFEGLKGVVEGGFTYGGHPVGFAVAIKAMEIYTRDRIVEHVEKAGKHIKERLINEFLPLPSVGDVTGIGFMGGMEIVADKKTKKPFDPALNIMANIKAKALEKGLFIRTASVTSSISDRVEWSCPLVMTIEEADKAIDILKPIVAELKPS
ncbi:aspartate aminotransferase family protein [Chloroflexota bacterium]